MPQIDTLADGGALRIDDDIPIERAAGTRKVHGLPADPPNASDSGTDAFQVNAGRDVNDEEIIIVIFGSANTTTTPTLENTGGTPTGGKTITMIDGSALWSGAIQNAVHVLQYDSFTDTWFLLNAHLTPTGLDSNTVTGTSGTSGNIGEWNADGDLVDSGVATADTLRKPGTSSDPALAFDTWRTPDSNRLVEVLLQATIQTDGSTNGKVSIAVDESGGTTQDYALSETITQGQSSSAVGEERTLKATIPAGGAYQVQNNSDPNNGNSIDVHREFTV